ncbi:MAG: PAS domain-containing protein [Candidatus Cloacimonetes bacterium]|jgi:DUF438 domain-containing protein|nr:PAS domain-containing protein [Candidatus Cloacimonadota bacterium]
MSEFINNRKKRIEMLFEFSQGILKGKDGSKLVEKYKDALEHITPHDMIAMEEKQLKSGISPQQIKEKIEKVMNVIYDHLKKYEWEKPQEGHALYYLMQENRELEKVLSNIKESLKDRDYAKVTNQVEELFFMEHHYVRKENILFPFLEKTWENCRPLSVMWSIHDDIRMKLKALKVTLAENEDFSPEIFKLFGEVFFLMYGMIFKEELVIYPVAMETLTTIDWRKIHAQSFEIGFSYITTPQKGNEIISDSKNNLVDLAEIFFQTETGSLSQQQLELVLNTVPLDLTFIDENDEVRYFSNPKDRFFPRSPAIIGRKVHKCHPPESVHIVEKILNAFKTGTKDEASFHIQMKGKFIFIRYFAVRDENDKYIGTLEISQDITEIKKIEGEMRLLDWE